MAIAPLNTKVPVKQYVFQLTFLHLDGSTVQVQTTTAQRSEMQNILDRLAAIATANAGQQLKKVVIEIGNGQDTA